VRDEPAARLDLSPLERTFPALERAGLWGPTFYMDTQKTTKNFVGPGLEYQRQNHLLARVVAGGIIVFKGFLERGRLIAKGLRAFRRP